MSLLRLISISIGFIFLPLPIATLSAPSPIHTDSLSEYKGSGLSIEYPADWILTTSGKSSAGNLTIKSSDACIFIAWARDPGIEPEKVLDQVEKTYGGGEMRIISSAHSRMRIDGENASILDLYYAMGKYGARKRFAVWNSSRSDRLFFATLSSSIESYDLSALAFSHMLETFLDNSDIKEARLGQRAMKGEAWAFVLGDLLASYSYEDTSLQLSRKVHIETSHSLLPINGTYRLSSRDEIKVDLPLAAIGRAVTVQDLLNRNGYDSRLIQSGGNIWVAVKDNSANWQLVSLNPSEPGMMIGVEIDYGGEGIVYRSIAELAEQNSIRNDVINNILPSIRKDCDPSRYVELRKPSPENSSWDEDLQKVLDSYDYEKSYRENIFDCSNTSQICWSTLQGLGYDARILMSYKGHPLDPHMWVVVRYPYEEERYIAIEATNIYENEKLAHLGKITALDDYYKGIMYNTSAQFSRLHPEEGMWLAA